MTRDLTPFTPDCGHTVTPDPSSIGTGQARDLETGETMCYPCADAREQEKIKTADVFTGYVSADGKRITTWTGGELAVITSLTHSRKIYTKSGAYRMRWVTARTPDGARWYGRSKDDADVITIRRMRG